jgi:hypothetical protein
MVWAWRRTVLRLRSEGGEVHRVQVQGLQARQRHVHLRRRRRS